jgi:oligoendopeptidase F
VKPGTRIRSEIPDRYKWDLSPIFPSWDAWGWEFARLEALIGAFATRRGSLAAGGPEALLSAFRAIDEMGRLAYAVVSYPSLAHDQDQRDNEIGARYQKAQILMARWLQATSWFSPEVLSLPVERVREWMGGSPDLDLYRFAIENLFRLQEHVLDEQGERLMSLASRFDAAPAEAYEALSTADVKFPTITLTDGRSVTVSYGEYRSILATARQQADREAAFRAYLGTFDSSRNTYASLYNSVCQRDWFVAQARGYHSTLEASLHVHNIPTSVVHTLVAVARAHAGSLKRYHRLRKRALGLERYCLFDGQIPIVQVDRAYDYDETRSWIEASVAPLGEEYQALVRRSFDTGGIDVYENEGKRSGAYSAPVYGVHPYMLLNHNDTLDAVFTLAHEMGHTIHTVLAHQNQPFVYSDYTIFVAEVPSTLSEALLLDYLLERTADARERVVLLEHAIENIAGTFFSQAMYADYELQAHGLVERDAPITAEILSGLWGGLLETYYGDSLDREALAPLSWARVPHFFSTPYYVYQYATCFASAAELADQILRGDAPSRGEAVERYLGLLKAGGSDYPMDLLRRAGVDLREPGPVEAVVARFDALVGRLARELAAVGLLDSGSPPRGAGDREGPM